MFVMVNPGIKSSVNLTGQTEIHPCATCDTFFYQTCTGMPLSWMWSYPFVPIFAKYPWPVISF
jgi:hypothetical protein